MKKLFCVIVLCLISPIVFAENGNSREERIETNYKLDGASIFLVVNNKTSMPMTVFNPLLEKNVTKKYIESQAIAGVIAPNGQGTFLVGSLENLMKQIGHQTKKDAVIKIASKDKNVCGGNAPDGYGLSQTCKELHAATYLKFSFPDGMSYFGTDIFKIGFIKEQLFKIQPSSTNK